MNIIHHGAVDGVTGSCHELQLYTGDSVLIDCGLFQGDEASRNGAGAQALDLDFPVSQIRALLLTHVHIDHAGRIPHLFGAGFDGPIYCSKPSAKLLPLVLEDALKIGVTRNQKLIDQFLSLIRSRLVALDYDQWVPVKQVAGDILSVRLRQAGHILGSAYIECRLRNFASAKGEHRIVFSGDLGAPHSPLLTAPKPPYRADTLIIESTYGDRLHEGRRQRRERLRRVIESAVKDRGAVLVPAFSIGRTQELLYELESIIDRAVRNTAADPVWSDIDVIVDSPLAAKFTSVYRQLRPYWDGEARAAIRAGRHPLGFEQMLTVDSHADHQRIVQYLRRSAKPAIVLAASGMCAGGRISNYLKALLPDPRTDVLFVGYQARGTPGRAIQRYGPGRGYVIIDGEKIPIAANIHTLSGYSAHADQTNLINFACRMRKKPREIRIIHGEEEAKQSLQKELQRRLPQAKIWIP